MSRLEWLIVFMVAASGAFFTGIAFLAAVADFSVDNWITLGLFVLGRWCWKLATEVAKAARARARAGGDE